jgi:hypothetical protein
VELNKKSLVVNFTLRDAAKFDRERESQIHQESVKNSLLVDSLRNDLSKATVVTDEVKPVKQIATAVVPGVISDDSHLENNDSDDDDEKSNVAKSSSSATATASTNTVRGVDPDSLKKYKVRNYPAADGLEASTNVKKIFGKSRPLRGFYTNFLAAQSDERGATSWREVLIEIASEYAKDAETARFIVQTKDQSSALLIDVLGLKVCPLSLVHKSFLKKQDESLKDADRDQFPLLLLKYNYTTKAMLENPVVKNDIVSVLRVETKTISFTATAEAILETRDHLQQKELVLAPGYVTRFMKENNTRVFRPSFVVPMAIEESEMKKEEGCCSLEGCSNPGWAVSVVLFVL